jgi:hypothetical protein
VTEAFELRRDATATFLIRPADGAISQVRRNSPAAVCPQAAPGAPTRSRGSGPAPSRAQRIPERTSMAHVLDPRELQSEAAYLAALDELDYLLSTDPDTPAGFRFDELVTLIEAWEARHHEPSIVSRWALDRGAH